ncbi:glyoxalase bleomycin resistance protein dioxygenase [Pyrenochaeta sp. DS3sAY3a]|nr:glyoxalase bleomycin resistance protein dioxygenase [Pyrenochaeta sp. DS3sAY3a]
MSAPAPKVLSPAVFAHVVLRTAKFKEMVAYYKTFLGAEASYENEMLSFLTYDEEHHRVAILGVPGTADKKPATAGLEHIAFAFKTLDDLALAYTQRKAHNILPTVCINHGPTTSMYYTDPDGNMIETQVDNFETAQEATDFMNSPLFAQNPIGIDFDPEDLIRRLQSGESHASIKKRVEIGPRSIAAA